MISLLAENNMNPEIICLQETWQVNNHEMFILKVYHKLSSNNIQGLVFTLNLISPLNCYPATPFSLIKRLNLSLLKSQHHARKKLLLDPSIDQTGNSQH
jgi:hypothetical protein